MKGESQSRHALLESLSLLHILTSWSKLRRTHTVTVYEPYIIVKPKPKRWNERLAWSLLKRLKGASVAKADRETRNRLAYYNNHDSDIYIESVIKRVRRMPSYRIMRQIVNHEAVDRIYSRFMLPKLNATSEFYRFAEFLLKKEDKIILIPTDDDYWNLSDHFNLEGACIPPQTKALNALCGWSRRISSALVLNVLVWPAVFAVHIAKRFRRKSHGRAIKAPVIIPLLWGFPSEDGVFHLREGKIKWAWTSASLLGEGLTSDNVAFYYSTWPFEQKVRMEQKTWMKKRNIQWFDPANFVADKFHYQEVRRIAINILKSLLTKPLIIAEPHEIVRISARILYYLLEELLFNSNVQYQVRVEWSEYLPVNVIRTIVANRFGRSTIAVHHSANGMTHAFPEIRYLYVNRLCLWHQGFREAYAHHWDAVECVPIGNHRLDYVIEALSPERLKELKLRISEQWNTTGPILLVALPNYPGRVGYQNAAHFPELYKGILQCLSEIPDLWVVMRARSPKGWQEYLLNEPLVRQIASHKYVISDYEELSTYEWIAVSDVTISTSTSSVSIEAGTAGKKCFSFDTKGLGEITFANYGSDFTLTKAEHLVRAVKGVLYGTPQLDCKWEKFAKDMTYFADGKNIARFQKAILDLMTKTEMGSKAT